MEIEARIREVVSRVAREITNISDITDEMQLNLSNSIIVLGESGGELDIPAYKLDTLNEGMTIGEIIKELEDTWKMQKH